MIIPAKGHAEVKDAGKNATCISTGLTEGSHCDVCKEILIAQREIPRANVHYLEQNICRYCHCTIDVSGLNIIRVPDAMKAIESESLASISAEVIVVPDGCTEIGEKAFMNCVKLKYIFLPISLETSMPSNAFEGCIGYEIIYFLP